MPSFFDFQQGTETRPSNLQDSSAPLLGRFRAVPNTKRSSRGGSVSHLFGSGYGSLFSTLTKGHVRDSDAVDGEPNEDAEIQGNYWIGWRKSIRDLWIQPQQGAVRRCCDKWWSCWGVLVLLPAAIVSPTLSDGLM